MSRLVESLKSFILRHKKLYAVAMPIKGYISARSQGLTWHYPNYIYFNWLDCNSTVIDVGCGSDADFSRHLIKKYGLKCYAVDPTVKHRTALEAIEREFPDRFKHLNFAVSVTNGTITFHESKDSMSGSIRTDHRNVREHEVKSYQVESVTPIELLNRLGLEFADFLKLDIEGAEFELLSNLDLSQLKAFKQIFVEFHSCLHGITHREIKTIVDLFRESGFKVFSIGGQTSHNFLFVV